MRGGIRGEKMAVPAAEFEDERGGLGEKFGAGCGEAGLTLRDAGGDGGWDRRMRNRRWRRFTQRKKF